MRKLRFLVDVDEVLADFRTPALEVMSSVMGRRYSIHDFDVWDIFSVLDGPKKDLVLSIIDKQGFCHDLQPFPEAQKAIAELQTMCEVYVVTSPYHSLSWVYERNLWLKTHYGFDKSQVVHTSAKYLVRGDIFLDDKPDHVEAWTRENPHGLGMLWHTPNTRGLDHLRVNSWGQVLSKVGEYGRSRGEYAGEYMSPSDSDEVAVGQVWRYDGTPYIVVSANDSRESLGSWVMSSLTGGQTAYMHRPTRLSGKWVKEST